MLHMFTYLTSMLVARADEIERRENGATATEYALIVAGIALVVLVAVKAFGTSLSTWFSTLGGSLTS